MANLRPLRDDERKYLSEYKSSLEEALRGFWVTVGLAGLPIGFLLSTLASGHAWHSEKVATVLAGVILLLLVALVLGYSPRARRVRRLAPSDLGLPGRLDTDLLAREAEVLRLVIESKLMRGPKKREDGAVARRFFLKLAGDREVEVTALRWMNVWPGQEVELELAPRSGLVLAIEGLRERLPLPTATRPERTADPFVEAAEGPEGEG